MYVRIREAKRKLPIQIGVVYSSKKGYKRRLLVGKEYLFSIGDISEKLSGLLLERLSEDGKVYYSSDRFDKAEKNLPLWHVEGVCGFHLLKELRQRYKGEYFETLKMIEEGKRIKELEGWIEDYSKYKSHKGMFGAIESTVGLFARRYKNHGAWSVKGLFHHMNLFVTKHSDVKRDYIPIYKDKEVHPIDPVDEKSCGVYGYNMSSIFNNKITQESLVFKSKVMGSYFF